MSERSNYKPVYLSENRNGVADRNLKEIVEQEINKDAHMDCYQYGKAPGEWTFDPGSRPMVSVAPSVSGDMISRKDVIVEVRRIGSNCEKIEESIRALPSVAPDEAAIADAAFELGCSVPPSVTEEQFNAALVAIGLDIPDRLKLLSILAALGIQVRE